MKTFARAAGVFAFAVLCSAPVCGQDTLAAARDLYGSAAYDEALTLLDGIRAGGDARAIEQYRALCLLALGRQAEAERAIELLFAADPAYRVDAAASPRVQAAFRDVRRRVLPTIVQQRYMSAKAAYDRKEYPSALAQFDATLALIENPEIAQGQEAALADLRTLMAGFRDLAHAALPPPPPPKPAPVAAPPPPPRKAFYSPDDSDVIPPAILNQKMPQWTGPAAQMLKGTVRRGVVEIMIGESGAVESAVIRQGTGTVYDDALLNEARRWRYTPATKDGVPVKYRKIIQFSLG